MPIFIIILAVLGIFGSISSSGEKSYSPSDIIIDTPTGGFVRNDADGSVVSDAQPSITFQQNTSNDVTAQEPESEPEVTPDIPPKLNTLAAQDVYTDRGTLRGELTFTAEPYDGNVYFIYGNDRAVVEANAEAAEQIWVSSRGSNEIYKRNVSRLDDNVEYFYRICFEAAELICGDVESFITNEDFDRDDDYRIPSVSTKSAEDINADTVTLVGKYTIYDEAENVAFFVYGEDQSSIRAIASDYDEYEDVQENNDDIQKVRAGTNLIDSSELEKSVDDLEKSTTYYYAFCVDYDNDEAFGIKCGSSVSFKTKDRNRDNPSVGSVQAMVNGQSVTMSARVSMEDYLNGHVFLVYGTSNSRITEVEEFDQFDNVRQYGDELQRVSLDIDHDGSEDFSNTARDLIASEYFYRFCVEYEAEDDRGRDDLFLACGDTESFVVE